MRGGRGWWTAAGWHEEWGRRTERLKREERQLTVASLNATEEQEALCKGLLVLVSKG